MLGGEGASAFALTKSACRAGTQQQPTALPGRETRTSQGHIRARRGREAATAFGKSRVGRRGTGNAAHPAQHTSPSPTAQQPAGSQASGPTGDSLRSARQGHTSPSSPARARGCGTEPASWDGGAGSFSAGLTHSLPLGQAAAPRLRPAPRRAPMPPPRCSAPQPRRSQPAASAAWHSSAGHLGTKGEKAELVTPLNALPCSSAAPLTPERWSQRRRERRVPGAAPARPGLTRGPFPSPVRQAELGRATAIASTCQPASSHVPRW